MKNKINTILFNLSLKSELGQKELVEKINDALNCKLEVYEGDEYDDDFDAWEAIVLGTKINLVYFKEEETFYLTGIISDSLLWDLNEETELVYTNINEFVFLLLKKSMNNEDWKMEVVEE